MSENYFNTTKPISEIKKMKVGDYLKASWYFEKAWEKLILVVLCGLGFWRVILWVF